MPLLQQQLYFDTKTKSGEFIQPFEISLSATDIVILAESTDEGFLVCTVTPLYTVENGNIPGVSIDIAQGEYIHINHSYSPYLLRIQPAFWLSNISITVWEGLPDNPLPDPHEHYNLETLGRISEQNNKLYFRNQIVSDHTHNNLSIISKFAEAEGKLYYLNQEIPNHTHDNLSTVNKLSEQDEKLYFNNLPVAELNHNHPNQLVLDKLSANNGTLLFYGVPVVEDQHTHTNLTILSKLSETNNQLLYNNTPITSDMTEVITAIDQQTNLLNSKLLEIESAIANLNIPIPDNQLQFTLITLNPTYQVFATNGWATTPTNLENLYDANNNTASNLFEINGYPWAYGEIILQPNISIPNFSRLYFKVGMQTSNSQRAEWELAVFDIVRQTYRNVWNYNGTASNTQDLIAEIDIAIPFQWDKLRFRLIDVAVIAPRARFYDLKVYEIS